MNNKSDNLKEKLKQALSSTAKVISDDFEIKDDSEKNKGLKKRPTKVRNKMGYMKKGGRVK